MAKKGATSHDLEVGRRIKMRRHELGVSQTDLGNALNLTFQQIQKYEKGANRVSAGRLQQIAKFLNVPVTFFYDDWDKSGGGSEISSLLASANSLRLLKAFVRIRDRQIQRNTVELIEAIADATDR